MTLYITEQGTTVYTRAGRLIARKGGQVLADLPIEQVRQLVLFGSVQLSSGVVRHCMTSGVDVCYLSSRGTYRGRLDSGGIWHVQLRQQQYEKCARQDFVLPLAVQFVRGKLENSLTLLKRYRLPEAQEQAEMERLQSFRARIAQAESLDSLRGYEGSLSDLYFTMFARRLPEPWEMPGRRRRPPTDPVNALLSLGYTLLYRQLISALHIAGLDPYQGCFHQPKHGHAALASDLMEEFRPVIVDTLVLTMLKQKELTLQDFEVHSSGQHNLTKDALKRFLERFDQRLERTTVYLPMNERHAYRHILRLQAQQFARIARGKQKVYKPYRWDW
jgi:CRISPR-associated protein Cas1